MTRRVAEAYLHTMRGQNADTLQEVDAEPQPRPVMGYREPPSRQPMTVRDYVVVGLAVGIPAVIVGAIIWLASGIEWRNRRAEAAELTPAAIVIVVTATPGPATPTAEPTIAPQPTTFILPPAPTAAPLPTVARVAPPVIERRVVPVQPAPPEPRQYAPPPVPTAAPRYDVNQRPAPVRPFPTSAYVPLVVPTRSAP